ncbi:MAG: Hpt domain-containing protein [Ardenticatenales bacterium]|nr:Hpt domain-containing protein [Ardenticatenales bacterium]
MDIELLSDFEAEIRNYLPQIRRGIDTYFAGQPASPEFDQALRLAHTIKGSAAMMGLVGLSQMARRLHVALQALRVQGRPEQLIFQKILRQHLSILETYLGILMEKARLGASLDTIDDQAFLAEIEMLYRPDEERLSDAEQRALKVTGSLATGPLPELLELFRDEAREHLGKIGRQIHRLADQHQHGVAIREIQHSVHTLKGGCGALGLRGITRLTHSMEDLFDQISDRAEPVKPGTRELLQDTVDVLNVLIDGDLDGLDDDTALMMCSSLVDQYEQLVALNTSRHTARLPAKRESETLAPIATDQLPLRPPVDNDAYIPTSLNRKIPAGTADVPSTDALEAGEPGLTGEAGPAVARIPVEDLDALIKLTNELMVNGSRLGGRLETLSRLIDEFQASLERLKRQAPFRSLPATKPLAPTAAENETAPAPTDQGSSGTFNFQETTRDLQTISHELGTLLPQLQAALGQQERTTGNLHERLLNIRLVPFGSLKNRLLRVVRTASRKQNKMVQCELAGDEVMLDKTILDQLFEPLLHLLRNAVDHGIETVAEREAAGKPAIAQIQITVKQEGNQLIITIADDGRGIDTELVRRRAVQKEFHAAAEAAALGERELYRLLFQPGFSTRDQITEMSGRGMGLDIVKAHIDRLQGHVQVSSAVGRGSQFLIRIPLTLAVSQAMLVMVGEERFAIPLADIVRVVPLEPGQLGQNGHRREAVQIDGHDYPLIYLAQALQLPPAARPAQPPTAALLIRVNGVDHLLVVDRLLRTQEVVVKSLGNHLRRVRGVLGATMLGEGELVLILNSAELVSPSEAQPFVAPAAPLGLVRQQLQVLIVDDSVSVRRMNEQMALNAGWEPVIARHGQAALELVESGQCQPDIALLDIEMPQMDGYELTQALRKLPAYAKLPIVIISARSGPQHREQALASGATAFLLKPYREDELRTLVEELISVPKIGS